MSSTGSGCKVPGCSNQQPDWVVKLPRDVELFERWLEAIRVGTGWESKQSLPADLFHPDATVCNEHFESPPAGDVTVGYREPTMFFRDNIVVQVACCALCLQYDLVDDMIDTSEGNIPSGNHKLSWRGLANKYFKVSTSQDGLYCKTCAVTIDMTHAFWLKVSDIVKSSRKLLKKQDEETLVFRKPTKQESESRPEEVQPTATAREEGEENSFEDVIVKEEPLIIEPDPETDSEPEPEQEPVPMPTGEPAPPLAKGNNRNYKCYVCAKKFATLDILSEHFLSHKNEKMSIKTCKQCQKSFAKTDAYNEHMAMHDSSKPYKCRYCSLRFEWRRDVTLHEGFQHAGQKDKQATNSDRKCPSCGKNFRTVDALAKHKATEHPTPGTTTAPIAKKIKLEK